MLRKFVAIISGVIILVLIPVYYLEDMNDSMVNDYVESRLVRFAASMKSKNEISLNDYVRLRNELAATDRIYDVDINHIKKKEVLVAAESGIYAPDDVTEVGIVIDEGYIEAKYGDIIEFNVYLVFSDNSRQRIEDYTSNYDPMRSGLQYVTIEYMDYTANVEVYVITEFTCEICGSLCEYESSYETGCDICKNTPISLMISPKYVETIKGYKPDITVIVGFLDGHMELTEEWEGTLDVDTIGERTVSIGYKGIVGSFTLNVLEDGSESTGEEAGDDEIAEDEDSETGDGNTNDSDTGNDNESEYEVPDTDSYESFIENGYGTVETVYEMTFTEEVINQLRSGNSYMVEPGSYYTIKLREKNHSDSMWNSLFGKTGACSAEYGGRM